MFAKITSLGLPPFLVSVVSCWFRCELRVEGFKGEKLKVVGSRFQVSSFYGSPITGYCLAIIGYCLLRMDTNCTNYCRSILNLIPALDL